MTPGEANRPGYDPNARRGHVESWFIRLNAPDGSRALWLKWTIFADRQSPARAECWAVAFERGGRPRGGKRSIALTDATVEADPFRVAFDGNRFDGTRAEGSVKTAAHDVTFAVDLEPRLEPLSPYPSEWLYRGRFPELKTRSPIPDAIARGFYTVDGTRIDVSGWRATQGHNWGLRHAHRYAWSHAFWFDEDPDAVFEGVSARLLKGIELPWLSVACLYIDGRWLRFDRWADIAMSRVEASVMHWRLKTGSGASTLEVEAHADVSEAAALLYANPGAALTHCLNSKLATLRLTLRGATGPRVLTTRNAALEIGWPSADHGIPILA